MSQKYPQKYIFPITSKKNTKKNNKIPIYSRKKYIPKNPIISTQKIQEIQNVDEKVRRLGDGTALRLFHLRDDGCCRW